MNHKKYYKKISRLKIIDVYEKIRELRLIESIPYTELINFLILFTKIEIVPLSNGNDPQIDLDYAKRFLAGKITAKKLHTREKYAWANYEILEGKEKSIQRITVSFLYPRIAEKNRLLGDVYEELFLFLELLFEIEDVLCDKFIAELESFVSIP